MLAKTDRMDVCLIAGYMLLELVLGAALYSCKHNHA